MRKERLKKKTIKKRGIWVKLSGGLGPPFTLYLDLELGEVVKGPKFGRNLKGWKGGKAV